MRTEKNQKLLEFHLRRLCKHTQSQNWKNDFNCWEGKKAQASGRIHFIPVNMRYLWKLNANTVFYTTQLSAFSIFSSKLSHSFISMRSSIISKWKWKNVNRIQDVCAYHIQYYVNRRVGNTENRSQCLSVLQG